MLCMHTDSWETNSFGTTSWQIGICIILFLLLSNNSIKTIMYYEESVKKPEEQFHVELNQC